jgi:hypothetical protein
MSQYGFMLVDDKLNHRIKTWVIDQSICLLNLFLSSRYFPNLDTQGAFCERFFQMGDGLGGPAW